MLPTLKDEVFCQSLNIVEEAFASGALFAELLVRRIEQVGNVSNLLFSIQNDAVMEGLTLTGISDGFGTDSLPRL